MTNSIVPNVRALRYVVPLREGGSLPAVVDVDDGETYVVKFRGAGQGPKALVSEVLAAALALELGLPVPQPAIVELQTGFGESEPDPEIQDILRGSDGSNFGLRYLPGALSFDPGVDHEVDAALAADVIWFDALVTNVDRTPRNPNLLFWRDSLWLIDHGACLYFHHRWKGWRERVHAPFPQIKDHVLLGVAGDVRDADERLRPLLTDAALRRAVAAIPGEWLGGEEEFSDIAQQREAYVTYLTERLHGPRPWLQEAIDARERGVAPFQRRLTHRVV